jgi:hypothetical protein
MSSPTLQLLVIRSLGGNGLILISRGLLSLLSEKELRTVLWRAALRARRSDAPLRGLASWVALQLLGRAPEQWLNVTYGLESGRRAPGDLSVASVVHFMLLLPLIRLFVAMSMLNPIERLLQSSEHPLTEELGTAMHKIHRAIQTWRLTAAPVRYPFL